MLGNKNDASLTNKNVISTESSLQISIGLWSYGFNTTLVDSQ